MQTILKITTEGDGTLLVSSDLYLMEQKTPDSLSLYEKKPFRLQEHTCNHPLLRERLVAWRQKKARELELSAFLILSNRTLQAIADLAPLTADELLSIHGFGPVMFDRYGEEILQMSDRCLSEEAGET